MKKLSENDNLFSSYTTANNHFDNKDFQLAVEHFDISIDLILAKDFPLEILSSTVFVSGDESNISIRLIDLYHIRGCAKFNIGNDTAIDDFDKAIKIDDNYEESFYMRGSAYFILLEDWQKAISDIKKYLTFSTDDKAGNQLLLVLEEIEENAEKIKELYDIALDDYSEGEYLLTFWDGNPIPDLDMKNGILNINDCVESLDKACELFSQKDKPNIYLNSHSFSLSDIYFKKLQCLFMLQKPMDTIMDQCIDLYNISKGLFRPDKNEIGAKSYYMVVEKGGKRKVSLLQRFRRWLGN